MQPSHEWPTSDLELISKLTLIEPLVTAYKFFKIDALIKKYSVIWGLLHAILNQRCFHCSSSLVFVLVCTLCDQKYVDTAVHVLLCNFLLEPFFRQIWKSCGCCYSNRLMSMVLEWNVQQLHTVWLYKLIARLEHCNQAILQQHRLCSLSHCASANIFTFLWFFSLDNCGMGKVMKDWGYDFETCFLRQT